MASDHILFHGRLTAGSVTIPMTAIRGNPSVRAGYGTARLVSLMALHATNTGGGQTDNVQATFTNSSWVKSLQLIAGRFDSATALAEDTAGYTNGRMAVLKENSQFNVTCVAESWTPGTNGFMDVYVLAEIDYDGVSDVNVATATGYPVTFSQSGTITATANVPTLYASPDDLFPQVEYLLSEMRLQHTDVTGCTFIVLHGFATQKGLVNIYPVKKPGQDSVVQVKKSVKLTKQGYLIDIINSHGMTAKTMVLRTELIASKNSI